MTDILDHTTSPPPELLYRYRLNVRRDLRDLWGNRRLVRTLAERDIRASYKQSFFGFAWAIVTPLLTVLVFTIFFKRIGKINRGEQGNHQSHASCRTRTPYCKERERQDARGALDPCPAHQQSVYPARDWPEDCL